MKSTQLYMLDTNTVSFILRSVNKNIRKRLNTVPINNVCISTITQAELLYGLERKPKASTLRKIVSDFLKRINIIAWDSHAAERYSEIRTALEKNGMPLGSLDTMIAAHALALNATLVSNDKAFARVQKLKIEDWTD